MLDTHATPRFDDAMAKQAAIRCTVITPERQLLDADASAVVLPAHDGEIGVLRNRAPLLCQLGIGTLRVDTVESGPQSFYVDGGFAQVLENRVTILTERAAATKEIDPAQAERSLTQAQHMPSSSVEAVEARRRAIARAKVQIRLAKQ